MATTHRSLLKRAANAAVLLLVAAFVVVSWPQSFGGRIAYVQVNGHSMDGTYRTGDLVVVFEHASYHVGDIVAYRIPKDEFAAGAQVIHRIIGGNGATGFVTKGDNRRTADPWHPRTGDMVGRAALRIPGAGIWFANLSRPLPLGVLCGGLTLFVMLLPRKEKAKQEKPNQAPPEEVTPAV